VKDKPKPRQFTREQLAVLWTVWALNISAAAAFAVYFPDQFRAVRNLVPRDRGLVFLIVPSIIVSFVVLWNSFGAAKRRG